MAHGLRGTELRGLALLDIAPFTTQGHYVAWYHGTMVCFNARYKGTRNDRYNWNDRYKGTKVTHGVQRCANGTKVNAWGS